MSKSGKGRSERKGKRQSAGSGRRGERSKKGGEVASSLRFSRINGMLALAGLAAIALGYVLLAQGSITLAPVLLVVGYVVLIPMAIIL